MSTSEPIRREPPVELLLDAHLHLLDRQVLDRDGAPACVVDDLELGEVQRNSDGNLDPPEVTGLLSSPALVRRLFGGRPPQARMHRVDWSHVTRVGNTVDLDCEGEALDCTWLERWVRDRIIARIPGGRHDPE